MCGHIQDGNDVLCAGPVHAARNLWISERVAFNTLVGKSLPLKDHFIHDSLVACQLEV